MSTARLKDEALEEYYSALFQMYGGTGWKKLQEDFTRMAETHNSLTGIDTVEQLYFRRGQFDIIAHVLSHQAAVEAAYASLLAEQEGGDEETPTGGVAKVTE